MDKDTAGTSIQDQYLARVRKDRSWLTVVLNSGKKIGGRVVSYDRYTVILEDHGREQLVFKHAIATIAASRSFANAIDFDAVRPGKERPERAREVAGSPRPAGGAVGGAARASVEKPGAGAESSDAKDSSTGEDGTD